MRRLLVVFGLAVVCALGLQAATGSAPTIRKCVPNHRFGIETEGNAVVVVYCGSAKATLRSGGKRSHFSGGACYPSPFSLHVGIGRFTSVSQKPKHTAFFLSVQARKVGRYKRGTFTLQDKGKSLTATVKGWLGSKRTRGTFQGTFPHGAGFSGSFTC